MVSMLGGFIFVSPLVGRAVVVWVSRKGNWIHVPLPGSCFGQLKLFHGGGSNKLNLLLYTSKQTKKKKWYPRQHIQDKYSVCSTNVGVGTNCEYIVSNKNTYLARD